MIKSRSDLDALLGRICSHEFAAEVKCVSSFTHARRAIAGHADALRLVSLMRARREAVERVGAQISELVQLSVDPRYESPWDAALSTLLWALSQVVPGATDFFASAVLKAPQVNWARQMASELIAPTKRTTQAIALASLELSFGATLAPAARIETGYIFGSLDSCPIIDAIQLTHSHVVFPEIRYYSKSIYSASSAALVSWWSAGAGCVVTIEATSAAPVGTSAGYVEFSAGVFTESFSGAFSLKNALGLVIQEWTSSKGTGLQFSADRSHYEDSDSVFGISPR
jgi:hypothetical protein